MLRVLTPALLLALAACAQAPTQETPRDGAPALTRLRVEGNHFVDASGATVVLRGVSFSDPDRLENANQWNPRYFQAAKDWNANVVRIPVHPASWRSRGEEAYLALLDQGVQWAGERGMYVIIDWHSIGNLATGQFTRDVYETTQAETLHFWETIAARYAGNPVVAFHELFNEPTTNSGQFAGAGWPEHRALMETVIARIRQHDTEAIPLVAAFDWGYDLRPIREQPVAAAGVAYVTHPYPQKRPPPWEPKWQEDWGFVADSYPIVATEFGFMSEGERGAHIPVIGDESYGKALIDFFEARGISWTAWVFDPDWSPQLLRGWDFEPSRQGVYFRGRMLELNTPPR